MQEIMCFFLLKFPIVSNILFGFRFFFVPLHAEFEILILLIKLF